VHAPTVSRKAYVETEAGIPENDPLASVVIVSCSLACQSAPPVDSGRPGRL